MIIPTTYEQYKNLPQNKGKSPGQIQKEWMLYENKLIMMYDSVMMMFNMNNNGFETNVFGPVSAGAGASTPPDNLPTKLITYYTPNGALGITLGYYTPDLSDTINSYYIYV